MRGDRQKRLAISHLPDNCPPKLAPLERLPKRHRVGPSASLDEYRTISCCESVSQGKGHVNLEKGCGNYLSAAFVLNAKINSIFNFFHLICYQCVTTMLYRRIRPRAACTPANPLKSLLHVLRPEVPIALWVRARLG